MVVGVIDAGDAGIGDEAGVGFSPTTPHQAAGIRIDPP